MRKGQSLLVFFGVQLISIILFIVVLLALLTMSKSVNYRVQQFDEETSHLLVTRWLLSSADCLAYEHRDIVVDEANTIFLRKVNPFVIDVNKLWDYEHYNCIRMDSYDIRSEVSREVYDASVGGGVALKYDIVVFDLEEGTVLTGPYANFESVNFFEGHSFYVLHTNIDKFDFRGNNIFSKSSQIESPSSIAVDRYGFVYVAGSGEGTAGGIRKLSPDGSALVWGYGTQAPISNSITVDNEGNVYAGYHNGDVGYTVIKLNNTGGEEWRYDKPTNHVLSVTLDSIGNLYAAENNSVHKLDTRCMDFCRKTLGNTQCSEKCNIWNFNEHEDIVNSVAVDSDGYVYSGSVDNTVRKIHPNGTEVWKFERHTDKVMDVAVDSDGFVYSASSDETVRKINHNGDELWNYTVLGTAHNVAVDSDGFVYIGINGKIVILNNFGEPIKNIIFFGNDDPIDIAIHPLERTPAHRNIEEFTTTSLLGRVYKQPSDWHSVWWQRNRCIEEDWLNCGSDIVSYRTYVPSDPSKKILSCFDWAVDYSQFDYFESPDKPRPGFQSDYVFGFPEQQNLGSHTPCSEGAIQRLGAIIMEIEEGWTKDENLMGMSIWHHQNMTCFGHAARRKVFPVTLYRDGEFKQGAVLIQTCLIKGSNYEGLSQLEFEFEGRLRSD